MSQGLCADAVLDHGLLAPQAPSQLPETIRSLLVSACASADLVTLELDVRGYPVLATTVRGACALPELSVWVSRQPPCQWHGGLSLIAAAADAGADRRGVVAHTASLVGELVSADLRATQAETLARRAIELAGVDALTELGNRRTWRRALDDESRRAARYGTPTTVAVVDVDDLKRLNDECGHAAGDAHLQRCADAVRACARSVDVFCRLGGDEFGLLAPQTGADGAARLAARLRAALDAAGVRASVGIATATDGQLDAAWECADAAMYADKRARR